MITIPGIIVKRKMDMNKNFYHEKTKKTGDLEQELSEQIDLSAFLNKNRQEFISPVIGDLVAEMLKKKNLTKSELAKRSGMSEVYLYQILNGRRLPSRDRMIALCVGLGCTLDESQELLRQGRFAALYARIRRDAVIMYALKEKWDINRLNDMLFEIEEETLI